MTRSAQILSPCFLLQHVSGLDEGRLWQSLHSKMKAFRMTHDRNARMRPYLQE